MTIEYTIGDGWVCGKCGAWIPDGEAHECPMDQAPEHEFNYSFSFNNSHEMRVEFKLDRIIELLDKILGEKNGD